MIEVRSLTRRYGDLVAVQDVSFTVAPGEVVGLVGPNGAGKTTTLRSIVGIIRPTSGQVLVAGHDIQAEPLAAKSALAFIPDEPHLFPHLTVMEHLRFMGRIHGVADVTERAAALLEELALADRTDALPAELSRGMKQKLAIACGLLHEPKALLLDEPLTGLDPGAIRRMKRTILGRAAAGTAVILSSHLLGLVEELCSRVLVIAGGRLVASGSVAEIAGSRPELAGRGLEDVFLALTGAMEHGGGGTERGGAGRTGS
ncbi:MAG TPA: ABC transporter ATP-binding protein [Longimicrobiales bacterium]|nr:ABC transporter ATP-binding protein [Longimicrobiales bacterium]